MFWPSNSSAFSFHIHIYHFTDRFILRRLASTTPTTIFALSSGLLPAAIAVLRISGNIYLIFFASLEKKLNHLFILLLGDKSEYALRQLTQKRKPFVPLQLFYTPIFDRNGRLLDRAMACFMQGN